MDHERAVAFRKRLVELGPAYVKLGQVLSTRPDLIPDSYIQQLQRLQDDVGRVPFADIEQIIQEQLGGRISKLFETFDHEPLATASLGQAHAATLATGAPSS
jgi:predicted unusual protein kinase regulating ubiquinone biosynthesis (AarF/ABC1/UbiB family)